MTTLKVTQYSQREGLRVSDMVTNRLSKHITQIKKIKIFEKGNEKAY